MSPRKPAPFARPISYGGHHGKSWDSVRAEQLQIGDMVTGFGRLTDVYVSQSGPESYVLLTNVLGETRELSHDERVQAFVTE